MRQRFQQMGANLRLKSMASRILKSKRKTGTVLNALFALLIFFGLAMLTFGAPSNSGIAKRLAERARSARDAGDVVRAYMLYNEAARRDPSNPSYAASRDGLAPAANLLMRTQLEEPVVAADIAAIEKEEGLAIVNDTTIAIANDNDFDIDSPLENGDMISEGNKTYLYVFTVPSSMKLSLSRPKTSGHPDTGMHPYPLRRSTGTVGQK